MLHTYDDVGNLTGQDYGNGDWVCYTYDHLNRVKNESWSSGKDVEYFYSSEGYLSKKVDNDTGEELNYTYDSLNRLIGSSQLDANGNVVQRTEHQYDDSNRLSKQSWQLGDKVFAASYTYDEEDGSLTDVTGLSGFGSIKYSYDGLSRLDYKFNNLFRQNYDYVDVENWGTTTQVDTIEYVQCPNGTQFDAFELNYKYDNLGNITEISNSDDSGDNRIYTYDVQGQMLTEKIGNDTYTYTYDTYGNIRTKTEPDGTVHTYEYGNSEWQDLLTKYDGNTIIYDEIGNPTSYNNGREWWDFTWSNGRQLTHARSMNNTVTYTYDMDGIRNSKTSGGIIYKYITQNGKVVRQTWGNNTFDVIYDPNGQPFACRYNDVYYVYVLNQQGDVIRIINGSNGATVAEYQYDAWGNILEASGDLAYVNPIRYRGYYYDSETGFYYLQSRYYDPSIGRFINADSFASTGQGFLGYNMFAYCNNNPVMGADPTGEITIATLILIGSAIVGAACAGYTAYKEYRAGFGAVRIIGDSICAGFAGFSIVYSGGMALYQCYQNYCYLNGITPVTEINLSTTPTIPEAATDTLTYVDQNGRAPQGYKGGKEFLNDGRNGGQILPEAGMPYHEC